MMIVKRIKILKYGSLLVAIFLFLFYYFYNEKDDDHEKAVKNSGGYKNSQTLHEKLKPKLDKAFLKKIAKSSSNPSDKSGSIIWDDIGAAHNAQDVRIRDEGYKSFAFNTLVSSRLSLSRDIPDTRHKACKDLSYSKDLPSASVIICFYREDLSVLLRTIHSVVNRSPREVLHEVILVNDQSDINIVPNATEHIAQENLGHLVKLITAPERLGLIRARIFGAKQATGDVLVFLDSHIEANVNWLEPLLSRIKGDKTRVVTPIIDIINADTFQYSPSPLVRGGFNWGLNFKWDPIPRSELQSDADFAKPFKSPTMAGGLFAMDRLYFHELGEYDSGMEVWGGENLELSFRLWMCGGSLEIVPCSRVGHVFRKRRPYGSKPGEEDTMIRNSLRVAKVWMDEYISHYYEANSHAKTVYYGNITNRLELRKKLNCKSFKWYMENIYPDLILPNDQSKPVEKYQRWDQRTRNYEKRFALQLRGTKLCLQSQGGVTEKKSGIALGYCLGKTKSQSWYKTDKSELVLAKLLCLDSTKKQPRLMKCHELGGTQEWKMREDGEKTAVYNMAAGLCLTPEAEKIGMKVEMQVCSDKSHLWTMIDVENKVSEL